MPSSSSFDQGIAEREPVAYQIVDSSLIIATFDLTDAPHGLYDLKVINPSGQQAALPYRFLVQRAIEPEVSIGIGGPRVIFAGDVGTYSVTFQNISNLDAPYTFFQVGTPELGLNPQVYGLPYQQFFTNVRGTPEGAIGTPNESVPWVSLDSITNTSGQQETAGYLLDQRADGYAAFTFNLATYPGLREMSERAFDEFRDQMAKKFPDLDALLADGQGGLEAWWEALKEQAGEIDPALPALLGAIDFPGIFESTVAVPGECETLFIPDRTHVYAAATSMTRDEFVAHQRQQASDLRASIIADPDAPAALLALAADERIWGDLYLAALEDAQLLRPDGAEPPIRTQQQIVSMMAMLASGVLFGPAGSDIRATGDVLGFFEQLRTWYGHNDRQLADVDFYEVRGSDKCGEGLIPVPALPEFADFDLQLSNPTRFEAFRVYVPWLPFEDRGAGLPIDFQVNGPQPVDGGGLEDLNLAALLAGEAGNRLASITGPLTIDTGGWLPSGQPLPYTIAMENAENASQYVSEIQVVAELDSDLNARSFALGDMKIGEITIHVPGSRPSFQGEFDLTDSQGFVLRVSAGVDLSSGLATWLLQAIDPLTGELLQDPARGLLAPNDGLDSGAGLVSYTIATPQQIVSGTEISAQARVLMNGLPPEETQLLVQTADGVAPISSVAVTRIAPDVSDYRVEWHVDEDELGSGFRHVTLYVAQDGGDFKIWQAQVNKADGVDVFEGEAGHSYEFLALATDVAGNREQAVLGRAVADDGSSVNLGSLPTVPSTNPPDFGIAPQPSEEPPRKPVFPRGTTADSRSPTALAGFRVRSNHSSLRCLRVCRRYPAKSCQHWSDGDRGNSRRGCFGQRRCESRRDLPVYSRRWHGRCAARSVDRSDLQSCL